MSDNQQEHPRNKGLLWLLMGALIAIVVAVIGTWSYLRLTTTNYELVDVSQPLTVNEKVVTAHGVASLTHQQTTVSSLSFNKNTVIVTLAHYQFANVRNKNAEPKSMSLMIYQYSRTTFEKQYGQQLAKHKQNNVKALNDVVQYVAPQAGMYVPSLSKADRKRLNVTTGSATYQKQKAAYASAGEKVKYHTHFLAATRAYQHAHQLNKTDVRQFTDLTTGLKFLQAAATTK